jgi:cytoplasmic tRNA 2-thiolation protein 2
MASLLRIDAPSDEPRSFLVPISMGVSSVSLLHILSDYLNYKRSRSAGRTRYRLHALHVEMPEETNVSTASLYEKLRERYPEHRYSTLSLSDIFDYHASQSNGHQNSEQPTKVDKLRLLLREVPSMTARADIIHTLLVRLVVLFAKVNSIDGILWAHTTTRLAEKILSETAKGRGFGLPWQVTDGESPYGIPFYYPLREVFKKELFEFVKMTDPPIEPLGASKDTEAMPRPADLKHSSIDILMRDYFESVEEQYPSIVSNVVRTSSRLNPSIVGIQRCKLCTFPITKELLGIDGWRGIQEFNPRESSSEVSGLCYGCARNLPPEAVPLLP